MNIGTNNSTGAAMWRYYEAANAMAAKSVRNIASGKRINSAADDAAGLAIVQSLSAQTRAAGVAQDNAQDAISMVRTADGALGNVGDLVQRMGELAGKAGSAVLSGDERQMLQQEYDQLAQEIDRIGQSSSFGGSKLFDGSTRKLQTGTGAGDTQDLTMGELSSSALGLDKVDLTVAGGAGKALEQVKDAAKAVAAQRGKLGAAENGIRHSYNNMAGYEENLAAGVSRIMDADIGRESINRSIGEVLRQTSIALMGRAGNLMQYNTLRLLR